MSLAEQVNEMLKDQDAIAHHKAARNQHEDSAAVYAVGAGSKKVDPVRAQEHLKASKLHTDAIHKLTLNAEDADAASEKAFAASQKLGIMPIS